MFPVVQNLTLDEKILSDPRGIVYKFDFKSKSYALKDGNLIELNSVEDQVKQWMQFVINTEYKMYGAYDGFEYGLSLKKYIGNKTTPTGLIASDIEDQLTMCIKLNSDIKELTSVKATKENDVLKLVISVKTINDKNVEVGTNV